MKKFMHTCTEFFWSVFSRIRTEYRDLLYGNTEIWKNIQIWKNADQKNSIFGQLSPIALHC